MADKVDGRLLRGDRTRRMLLREAMNIASIKGLDGLTIGRLANVLGVSKSGIFGHFPTKEALQLAVIKAADEVFIDLVVKPGLGVVPGIGRAWRLCSARLDFLEERVFPGGCLASAIALEFDARPGRVRDAIARGRLAWLRLHQRSIDEARQLGEIIDGVDARLLAFELDAYAMAANLDALLHDDAAAISRARTASRARLSAVATEGTALSPHPTGQGLARVGD